MSRDTHLSRTVIDIALKAAAVFILLFWCFSILKPFILLLLWGAIIAIALYPLAGLLHTKSKLSKAKSSILISVVTILFLVVPVIFLSIGLYSNSVDLVTEYQNGQFVIPEPNIEIKDWPLIGEKAHAIASLASNNLAHVFAEYSDQIAALASKIASILGSLGSGVIQFLISIMIAGAFMVNAKKCHRFSHLAARRLAGENGKNLIKLSITTVRSVVQGVIGVAFIQATLAGIGMVVVGVPVAGLWVLLVLITAIIQLPPILALLPVILYVFNVDTTLTAVLFTVWCISVSASDAILKPVLLSRGSSTPMLIILLGALGGMAMSGIVGLFVGAVILSLSYQLLCVWLSHDPQDID